MPKMVILAPLGEAHQRQLEKAAPGWQVLCNQAPAALAEHSQQAEIIGAWSDAMNAPCLRPGTSLRWVQHWGAGVDYLPLEQFEAHSVMLTDASGVHAYPISETVFAMMLALTRKLHVHIRNQQQRLWTEASFAANGEMHGKTIAIVGVGAIGGEIARLAKAFRMKTLGVRRSGKAAADVDEMHTLKDLPAVLAQADYLVNILLLTSEIWGLFGEREFAMMKFSALFFNVGCGLSVDEQALTQALVSGTIAGAGLDVFEREPLDPDSALWAQENVIISPHTSGYTDHYNDRVMDIFLPNLRRYLLDQDPQLNRVDYRQRY